MKLIGILKHPGTGLLANFSYAIANCTLGLLFHSWWFVTLGAYYAILTVSRFSVLRVKQKSGGNMTMELFAERFTGILIVILSFCLTGIITLSAVENRGTDFHEIVMITVATYTFVKVGLAMIGIFKARKIASPVTKTLRNLSLVDALVSIYSLQRSMLVSFPGMAESQIKLFNILTGTGVWLLVLLLGINLIGGRCVQLAKSKIAKANEKIASSVVSGYKKVEQGVLSGYQKIENGAVRGYTKMEDQFVEAYLTKDGETVEEAKARLKKKTGSK